MPPALSSQSLLTFPDTLQHGGESDSEPVESDGHNPGLCGDATKHTRQCARTSVRASTTRSTSPPEVVEARDNAETTPKPLPLVGSTLGPPSLKRRLKNPTQSDYTLKSGQREQHHDPEAEVSNDRRAISGDDTTNADEEHQAGLR